MSLTDQTGELMADLIHILVVPNTSVPEAVNCASNYQVCSSRDRI